MLKLATPPDRPRPALLASIGIHALAAGAFGFVPALAFPDAPGWRGEVWVVTQPDLSALRDAKPVELRDRVTATPRRASGGDAARPPSTAPGPRPSDPTAALSPRVIPDELPQPGSWPPSDDFDEGFPSATGPEPGEGSSDGGGDGTGGPFDARGGALPPDIVLPVPLETPSPRYPDTARIARASGTVVLSATIASDGRVVDVGIESGVSPLLDRVAVEAVSRWRYVPARIGSTPVAVILRVRITFRLV